jgi:hypothetical protein
VITFAFKVGFVTESLAGPVVNEKALDSFILLFKTIYFDLLSACNVGTPEVFAGLQGLFARLLGN